MAYVSADAMNALTDAPMAVLGVVMLLRSRAVPPSPARPWWRTLWTAVAIGHLAGMGHHVALALGAPVFWPAALGVVFTLCYTPIMLSSWRLAALLTADRTPPGLAVISVLHPALVCALILLTSWRPEWLPVASISSVIHWEAGVLILPAGAYLIAQAFRAQARIGPWRRFLLATLGQAVVLGWAAWFAGWQVGPFGPIALYHVGAFATLIAIAVALEPQRCHETMTFAT